MFKEMSGFALLGFGLALLVGGINQANALYYVPGFFVFIAGLNLVMNAKIESRQV